MKAFIPFLFIIFFMFISPVKAENTPYSYEIMANDLLELEKQFPDHIEIGSIGKSEYNRDLLYAKVGKGNENILLIGSHHAREWITSQFLIKLLQSYVQSLSTMKDRDDSFDVLNRTSIYVVPMLNPDGVEIQQFGLNRFKIKEKMELLTMNHFSFDFKRWKANGLGVDLNRQYPAGWEELNKIPAWPSYKQFRGRSPAQAKEVQNIMRFTKELNPLLSISYHTSGQEIYWFYNNEPIHIARDYALAEKISKITGYELAFPQKNAVGGGFTDWFITEFQRPGFTLELCEDVIETNPPTSCLKREAKANLKVPIMLLNEVMKKE